VRVNVRYIARDNPRAAERFANAVETTFRDLGRFPRKGAVYESPDPAVAEIRIVQVRRFRNYVVFYRIVPDCVYVLAVLHAARDLDAELAHRLAP
jgi:toxin ParE1/3/4